MPVDHKKLVDYIGLDLSGIEDNEAANSLFDATFLRKDKAHTDKDVSGRVFGHVNNVLRSRLKGMGKEFGIDLGKVDDADPVDIIATLSEGAKGSVSKLNADLESARKAADGKEYAKEYEARIASITKERDAFGSSAKEWEKKYNDIDATVKAKDAQAKVDNWWSKAEGSVKFRDDVSALTRRGFMASVREKFRPDFDGDTVKVLDSTGAIIMDKKKAQTFATINDLIAEAANAERLTVESSPSGGRQVNRVIGMVGAANGQPGGYDPRQPVRQQRQVMPRS